MEINYRRTTVSCFVGIFVQAIITNLTALLFVPMMDLYGFSYQHLGILVGINFTAQVTADILCSGLVDKLGFRKMVLPTNILSFLGLILFALAPVLFPGHVFVGIVIATIIFAFSGGLLEILLSPIIAAIPGDDKGPAMSLMHSFYAWGQVATIILTTVFLFVSGSGNWQMIALMWAVVPLVNFFMFLKSPFPSAVPEEHRQGFRKLTLQPFFLLALAAIFLGGGAEVAMNQWASTFMEKGLALPKLTGDLLGMCGYAVMIGVGRMLYGIKGAQMNLHRVLIGGALLSVLCYMIAAVSPLRWLSIAACILCGLGTSLLWPGTLVVSSERYPLAGAWMFAILAMSGDVGAAVAPWLTGVVVDWTNGTAAAAAVSRLLHVSVEQGAMRIGIMVVVVFPLLALVVHCILYRLKGKELSGGLEPGSLK